MSHLKEIMCAKCITLQNLATLTGLSYPTLWRLVKEDSFETSFKSTQQKIASALGVSVRDIVYGKDMPQITEKEKEEMKNKIVETEVIKATEHLARLLRNYSESELYLHITIFTKDKECMDDDFKGEVPDYYSYRLNDLSVGEVDVGETLMNDSGRIYYADVDGKAYIKKVVPYHSKEA